MRQNLILSSPPPSTLVYTKITYPFAKYFSLSPKNLFEEISHHPSNLAFEIACYSFTAATLQPSQSFDQRETSSLIKSKNKTLQ